MADLRIVPLHFVAPSKECVVEVVAENVDVFRVAARTRHAALATLAPDDPEPV